MVKIANPNVSGFTPSGLTAKQANYATRGEVNQKDVDKIVDKIMADGVRTNADVIDYGRVYQMQRSGKMRSSEFQNVTADTVKTANLARRIKFENNFNMGGSNSKQVNFEQQGGFLVDNFNTMVTGVVSEAYDNSVTSSLAEYFPFAQYPASQIVLDVFAAPGGMVAPYKYGEPVAEVSKIGNRTYTFSGIPYRSFISIGERDIAFDRQLGDPNISARGILQRLTMYAMQAKVMVNNRINEMRSTIFANGINYYNDSNTLTNVSYQIPSYNQVVSMTDPINQWGTIYTQSNRTVPNPLSNPLYDMYFYLKQYLPWVTKFGMVKDCKIIWSPLTESLFLQNPNVRSQVAILQGQPGAAINPRGQNNAEFLLQSLIPGINISVHTDMSARLLENSDVTWAPDGSGFTSTPVAQTFNIPPGAVMFAINVERHGGQLGEFVFTTSIQNGGFVQATPAPWFIIEDLTAPGSRGGPLDPSLQLDYGFAGGVRVTHPEGVLIGSFAVLVDAP